MPEEPRHSAVLHEVVTETSTRAEGVFVRWAFALRFSDAPDATWRSDWTGEPIAGDGGRVDLRGLFESAHLSILRDLRESDYEVTVAPGVEFAFRADSEQADRLLAAEARALGLESL